MKIQGMNGESHNVTSQGQGTYNTVAGSAGLASFLGFNAGNFFNRGGCNSDNGSNYCNCNNSYVSQREMNYANQVSTLMAEKYADNIAREEAASIFAESRRTDDKISSVVKEVTSAFIETGKSVAELNQIVKCLQLEVSRNRDEARAFTTTSVEHEAQLRKAADENLAAWTQAELNKKINGTLKIDGAEICYGQCRPILEACPCGSTSNPYNVNVIIEQAVAAAVQAVKTTSK